MWGLHREAGLGASTAQKGGPGGGHALREHLLGPLPKKGGSSSSTSSGKGLKGRGRVIPPGPVWNRTRCVDTSELFLRQSANCKAAPAHVGHPGQEAPDGVALEDDDDEEDQDESNGGDEDDVPFPAELRVRQRELREAQAFRDRALEAMASLALAELQLRSGRFSRAERLAATAEELFTRPDDQARALRVRLHAGVRLPEWELFADVPAFRAVTRSPSARLSQRLRQAEGRLASWQGEGHTRAATISSAALADAWSLLGDHPAALKAASRALDGIQRLEDGDEAAAVLLTTSRVHLRLGTDLHTRRALEDLEKALAVCQRLEDTRNECAVLLLLSKVHWQRHEYQDAYAFAGGSVKLAQAHGHDREEALAMQQVARVLLSSKGDPDRAAQLVQDAAEVFHQSDDWLGEIAARHILALAYQADGFVNMAHEALTAALGLARKLRDVIQIRAALEGMAALLTQAQAPDAALQCLEEERLLACGSAARSREWAVLASLARLQSRLGRHDEARKCVDRAREISRTRAEQAEVQQLAAEVHLAAGQPQEGLAAARGAQMLYRKMGDTEGQVVVWRAVFSAMQPGCAPREEWQQDWKSLVATLVQAGCARRAAELHLERAQQLLREQGLRAALPDARHAVRLFESANDQEGLSAALLWLCGCEEFALLHPDEAMTNAETARRSCARLLDSEGEVRALGILAREYLRQRMNSKALSAAQEALRRAREVGCRRVLALAMRAVAETYGTLVRHDTQANHMPSEDTVSDVVGLVEESVQLCGALGDDADQAPLLVLLSRLQLTAGDHDAALQAAEAGVEVAQRLNDVQLQGQAFQSLAEVEARAGHSREARNAAEQALGRFTAAHDEYGRAEATRLLRGSKRRKRSGQELLKEFEQHWASLCIDRVVHGHMNEGESKSHILGSPGSAGAEQLKWFVWNAVWHAANTRFAGHCEGEERELKLESASEDLMRMEKHLSAAQSHRILASTSFESLGQQAEAAGIAAADAAADGRSLVPNRVPALAVPDELGSTLWTRLVQTIRLAAAAVTELMLQPSSSQSSSSPERSTTTSVRSRDADRGWGGGHVPPAAASRPIDFAALGASSRHGPVVDIQELERAGESRRTRLLARPSAQDLGFREEGPLLTSLIAQERDPVDQDLSLRGAAPTLTSPAAPEQRFIDPDLRLTGEVPSLHTQEDDEKVAERCDGNLAVDESSSSVAEENEEEVEECTPSEASVPSLSQVLQAVRPDWSVREQQAVLSKLEKVQVTNAEELFSLLRSKGVRGLNNLLKMAGQKCLRSDTLEAFLVYAEAGHV